MAKARIASFEWMRAVGCVAIVALHVFVSLKNAVGVSSLGPARLLAENVLVIVFGRWAVPCFLMMSGALLLDPEREVGLDRIWRYAVRMLFTLGTFGLLFCLIESVYDHKAISPSIALEAVVHLLTGKSWGHLWYVYALLGLYMLTLPLRALVARLDQRTFTLLLAAYYVAALVIPTGLWTQGEFQKSPFNIVPAVFYFALGWYVRRYVRLNSLVLGGGAISLVALLTAAVMGASGLALPEFCLIAPYAVMIFCLFRRLARRPVGEVPAAALLADYSFGIYVVHPFFLHVITHLMDPLSLPVGIYELFAFSVALAGSIATVYLVRFIPGFKGKI